MMRAVGRDRTGQEDAALLASLHCVMMLRYDVALLACLLACLWFVDARPTTNV